MKGMGQLFPTKWKIVSGMSVRVLTDQKTASVPSIRFGRLEVVPGVVKGDQ